jgi:hypothetical protein
MAGATGLEPATFGVTGREINPQNQKLFRLLMCGNAPEYEGQLECMIGYESRLPT